VSPVTVSDVEDPEAAIPSGLDVTVYEEMAESPLYLGAVKVTVACPFLAFAFTLVGAPGGLPVTGPVGVTAVDGAETGPIPAQLVAVTVKV